MENTNNIERERMGRGIWREGNRVEKEEVDMGGNGNKELGTTGMCPSYKSLPTAALIR